jgi:hypothetical protein
VTTDATEPDTKDAEAEAGDPYYAYKPSMLGSPWEFALRADGIEWRYGRHSGFVRYDNVRRVRMSYRPMTMQSHRFLTEIWSAEGPKIPIASTSWKSLVEHQRLDSVYSDFIVELHRRMASAGSTAQFSTGTPPPIYWLGATVFAGLMIAMIVLLARSLFQGDWMGAAVIGGLFALFGWQVGNFFHRNMPRRYGPSEVPAIVLPGR